MARSSFTSFADRDAVEAEAPWEEVRAALPATVYGLLTRARDSHASRPAVSFQLTSGPDDRAETLTWGDLHGRVTQAANLFRSLGIGERDVVAFVLPNCNETVVTLLGAMTAGMVNPINPLLEPATIAAILRETDAKAVVTLKSMPRTDVAQKVAEAVENAPNVKTVLEVDLARYLPSLKKWLAGFARPKNPVRHRARIMDFSRAIAGQRRDRLDFAEGVEDRVAAYFHTGGTTGLPKVAKHRFTGMIYNGWLGQRLLFGPDDVLLCPLPLFHVFAAYPIMMSLLASGAHGVFPTPQGYRGAGVFENFWKLVERWGVTFMIAVPTAIAALMQRKVDADVSTLQCGISGSAALPMGLYQRFEAATGVQISEGYGLTEATCLVSCNPIGGMKKVGSAGIPFPHTEIRILRFDDEGAVTKRCDIDEIGEICVWNPGVAPESIYTEMDKNRKLFAEGRYLRTGDLGRLDPEGYLWITGRAKDVIIRGGHNIDPAMIEEALLSHPAVAFAGAVGQPDSFAGELPCAYVELTETGEATPEELLKHARERIQERAALPRHVEILDELPKTAVGKVFKPDLRRRAIRRVFGGVLDHAKLAVAVDDVVDDRKRGLVVCLRPTGAVDEAEVATLMGSYAVPWQWVE